MPDRRSVNPILILVKQNGERLLTPRLVSNLTPRMSMCPTLTCSTCWFQPTRLPLTPLFQLPLDSVILTEVILTDTVTLEQYTLADIGLEIVCNNLGSSPDPCTLIAGAQYCASLEGTPTAGGVFQMSLDVAAWVTVFGLGVAQPYSFAGYILDVIGEPINQVGDLQANDWSVYPNPANDVLTVQKASPDAWVEVYNVAGQTMPVSSNQATSHVLLETASWTNGLYFVVHHDAAGTSTRRVVVQH